MTVAEAEDEYLKAVRLGQKECAVLQGKGQNPFPVVLDQILGDGVSEGAQNVGTLEIPIERIVGVKSAGRISAFSAGFFPLLDCESEFAMKWMTLCRAHQGDEGIRDPIICYEYLGNFYVQEGNKRTERAEILRSNQNSQRRLPDRAAYERQPGNSRLL